MNYRFLRKTSVSSEFIDDFFSPMYDVPIV